MNPFFIFQFNENKEQLRAAYVEICGDKQETEFSFSQIFKMVLDIAVPFAAKERKWDEKTVSTYQDDNFIGLVNSAVGLYVTEVAYGTCDSCDVIDYINQYCFNKEERQRRVEALMAVSLHIVQQLKRFPSRDVDSFKCMEETMIENGFRP